MALTDNERQTRDRYNLQAEDWMRVSGGINRRCFWPEEMTTLVSMTTPGSLGIEVGCGPATDGKYLRDSGLVPVSVDYSQAMLDLARQADPDATLMLMNAYALEFGDNLFSWFWATALLLHLEKPEVALAEMSRVTKPDGHGVVTVKEGQGSMVDPTTGYYFHYYSDPEMSGLLDGAKMKVVESRKKPGVVSGKDWLTYVVQVKK